MDKSSTPRWDWLSENIRSITNEWFRLVEWLLMVGALLALHRTVGNQCFFPLICISIPLIWSYIFFGLSQWFFKNQFLFKSKNLLSMLLLGAITTLLVYVFFRLADLVSSMLENAFELLMMLLR